MSASRGGRGPRRPRGPRGRERRGAAPEGERLVVGPRFVQEALAGGTVHRVLVAAGQRARLSTLEAAAAAAGVPLEERSPEALDALADGVRHQGVVALGPPYPYRPLDVLLEDQAPSLVALDEVTDPHNLGAILRSAVAFGATGILLPRHRSARITPTVVRASAGATERARIAEVTNLQRTLQDLGDRGLQIIGLAGEGDVLLEDVPAAPLGRVVVIGSEGSGLRRLVRERCELLVRIPFAGPVESLNASVAAGIALHALRTS
ncbi:MAG: 23S rRNA (guanosine(2251)-2'-O)-methyltransferase RlmB [Myxococcota bacterium]